MGDNSEYRLLSISIKKPPKYGSVLSKDLTQRQNYITHNVQKDETLQGIALKYNVSMEKIKRANNLWTSDSLFLRPTLSIPIDRPNIEENSLNGKNGCNSEQINGHHSSLNSSSSSGYLNGNGSLNNSSNSSSALSTSTSKSSVNNVNNVDSNGDSKVNSNEMLKAKDESMDDFLLRIDQYIKQSKVKMDSFANSSEIIISSKSDDNIFQHLHSYNPKPANYRQHSLRNNDICLNEIRDKHHNHENREIIYSLRKLEKEQEEREKYEL